MLNYYLRLEKTGSTFPLLNDTYMYIESKLLHNAKKSSWYSSIKFVLDKVSSLLNVDSSKINGERLKDYLVKYWQKILKESSSGKLCSYYLFKNNFGCENYLSLIKNFGYRRSLARFRISAHKLYIETGRYQDILRHDRICTRCSINEVEVEQHYIFTVLVWNQKVKYYMIPLKKVVLILNILTIRSNLYG
jgi:hypothetical protein